MTLKLMLIAVMCLMTASLAVAADEKKADATITMELRANEAFNRGQNSLAKDLFAKVVERIRDEPGNIGPYRSTPVAGGIERRFRGCDCRYEDVVVDVDHQELVAERVDESPESIDANVSCEHRGEPTDASYVLKLAGARAAVEVDPPLFVPQLSIHSIHRVLRT